MSGLVKEIKTSEATPSDTVNCSLFSQENVDQLPSEIMISEENSAANKVSVSKSTVNTFHRESFVLTLEIDSQTIRHKLHLLGQQLIEYWLVVQSLSYPPDGLRKLARLMRQLSVVGWEMDSRNLAEQAKDIEWNVVLLLRQQGVSNPEVEEGITPKLKVLGDLCRNESLKLGMSTKSQKSEPSVTAQLRPLLYVYDLDYLASGKLMKRMSMAGFDVRSYRHLDDIEESVTAARPLAIVADITFQEGEEQGFKRLQQIRHSVEPIVPVFYVSKQENMKARMAAVKMGVAGFFLKPVAVPVLASHLFDLAQGQNFLGQIQSSRVLLVDDEMERAKLLRKSLSSIDCDVQWLTDYNKTIFAARDCLPDLIILNIVNRNINPVHLVRLLRQDDTSGRCQIIVLGTEQQKQFYVGLVKEGVTDFILTTISTDQIVELIDARLKRFQKDVAARVLESRLHSDTQLCQLPYFHQQVVERLDSGDGQIPYALLHVRIDQAKQVIEKYGTGRLRVLRRQVAETIIEHMEPDDFGACVSDDEFIVLYKPLRLRELDLYCQTLCTKIADFSLNSMEPGYHITASIGVCQIDHDSYDLALIDAKLACTLAHKSGGNRVEWNTELKEKDERQRATQKDLTFLQEAIDEQRLYLLFQAIASLATEDIERYDVLLRFRDVDGAEVEPTNVLLAAREHDMSRYVDRWVVHAAMKELSKYTSRGSYPRLFLKLSVDSASDPNFIPWLEQLFDKYELRSEQFVFVMEERDIVRHTRHVKPFFSKLHTLGCRLEIAGFGESANCTEFLKGLNVDYLKLYPALIENIADDPEKQKRLTQLCNLARQSNAKVLASFIEDPHLLVTLCRYGIDLFQGYMLQKPTPVLDYDFAFEM